MKRRLFLGVPALVLVPRPTQARQLVNCLVIRKGPDVWKTYRSYAYACGVTLDVNDLVTRYEIEDASDFPRQRRDQHLGLNGKDLIDWLDRHPERAPVKWSVHPLTAMPGWDQAMQKRIWRGTQVTPWLT